MNVNLNSSRSWYVRYKHEKRINKLLEEKGLESFLPLITTIKQWSDRKKKSEVPLFASYLFVKVRGQSDIEKTLSIKESCFFLKFGGHYAKATGQEIKNIKLFLKFEDISEIEIHDRISIEVGKKYVIDYGAMKGLNCEVFMKENKKKVRVIIESINQNITATIPTHYLSPMEIQ